MSADLTPASQTTRLRDVPVADGSGPVVAPPDLPVAPAPPSDAHEEPTRSLEDDDIAPAVDVPLTKRVARRLLPATARFRIRNRLLDSPGTSGLWIRSDAALHRFAHLDRDTDLLIDGFPRSGNSYAAAAFTRSNPSASLVSHVHSTRPIVRAVRLRVPTIVLLRDPRAAVPSLIQFEPLIAPSALAHRYITYYSRVLDVVDRVLVVDFDDAISDFGAVIGRCNDKFGTAFARYEATRENEELVREEIDGWTRRAVPEEQLLRTYPRPTPERVRPDEILDGLDAAAQRELGRAVAVYERLRRLCSRGEVNRG